MNTLLLPHAFGPSSLGTDRLQSLSYPRAGSDRVVVGRQPNGVELSCPMGLACDGEHVFVAESGVKPERSACERRCERRCEGRCEERCEGRCERRAA